MLDGLIITWGLAVLAAAAVAFLYLGLGELEFYLVAAVDLFHVGIGHGVLFLIEAVNLGVALCNAFLQPVHLSAGVVVLRGHHGSGSGSGGNNNSGSSSDSGSGGGSSDSGGGSGGGTEGDDGEVIM